MKSSLNFGQRLGHEPIRVEIQKESADAILRNDLWNILYMTYLEHHYDLNHTSPHERTLFTRIWINLFNKPIDDMSANLTIIISLIKDNILRRPWYTMFGTLEFIPHNYEEDYEPEEGNKHNIGFYKLANDMLERNLSACRFLDGLLTELTSDQEIQAIFMANVEPDRTLY